MSLKSAQRIWRLFRGALILRPFVFRGSRLSKQRFVVKFGVVGVYDLGDYERSPRYHAFGADIGRIWNIGAGADFRELKSEKT